MLSDFSFSFLCSMMRSRGSLSLPFFLDTNPLIDFFQLHCAFLNPSLFGLLCTFSSLLLSPVIASISVHWAPCNRSLISSTAKITSQHLFRAIHIEVALKNHSRQQICVSSISPSVQAARQSLKPQLPRNPAHLPQTSSNGVATARKSWLRLNIPDLNSALIATT